MRAAGAVEAGARRESSRLYAMRPVCSLDSSLAPLAMPTAAVVYKIRIQRKESMRVWYISPTATTCHIKSQGRERDAIFQARSEESECQRSERSPAHNRVCTAFSCRMHASLERLPAPGGERQRRLLVEASAPPLIPLVKKCTDRLCRQPEGGGAEALGGLLPATSQRRL